MQKNITQNKGSIIILSFVILALIAFIIYFKIEEKYSFQDMLLSFSLLLSIAAFYMTVRNAENNNEHQNKIILNQHSTIQNMTEQLDQLKATNEIHTVALKEAYRPIMTISCEKIDYGIYFKLINIGTRTAYNVKCEIDTSEWDQFVKRMEKESHKYDLIALSSQLISFNAYKNYAPEMYRETMIAWTTSTVKMNERNSELFEQCDKLRIIFKIEYASTEHTADKTYETVEYDMKQIINSIAMSTFSDNYYFKKIAEALEK